MTHKKKAKPINPVPIPKQPVIFTTHWDKLMLILLLVIPLIYFLRFLSPGVMIQGSDYVSERFPLEYWTSNQKTFPLWYPNILAGLPVFGSPIGIPLAPLTWLIYVIPAHVVLTIKFIVFFFVAGLGMYLYLKNLGLSRYAAALGAFTYQFAGNLATTPYAGHAGRAASVAILPLLLFLCHRALQTGKLKYFISFSLTAALAFYEGQFQINYYGLLFILAYVIYYLISRRREFNRPAWIKTILFIGIALTALVMLMLVVWLPVLSSLKFAARGVERGYAYSTSWAMPAPELIDLLVPSFSGLLENYWGANPFKLHTEYFGLLAVFLAVLTLIRFWRKPYVRFYAISLFVVILIALGKATFFFHIPYTLIPGFTMFRAPSLIFYLAGFNFIVLAAIGFDKIALRRELEEKKYLSAAAIFFIFFIIMMIIALALGPSLAGNKTAVFAANQHIFIRDIFLAAGLLILGFIIILFAQRQRLPDYTAAISLLVLTSLSLLPVMARFLPAGPGPEKYYAPDEIVRFLKQQPDGYRIFPLLYGRSGEHGHDNYLWYHDFNSCGGASPNPLQRYQDYIGAGTSVMFNPMNLVQYPVLVDLLNIRYIIGPTLPEDLSEQSLLHYDLETRRALSYWITLLKPYEPLYRGRESTVYKNDHCLPRAYLVADYQVVESKDVLTILTSPAFNPRQTVILEEDPNLPRAPSPLPMAEAKITEYTANRVVCQTDHSVSGFLVLADNWHPDWRASVDGQPVRLYRANYIFRAVYVPSGHHQIVFSFVSPAFNTGKIITIITLLVCLGLLILPLRMKKTNNSLTKEERTNHEI